LQHQQQGLMTIVDEEEASWLNNRISVKF